MGVIKKIDCNIVEQQDEKFKVKMKSGNIILADVVDGVDITHLKVGTKVKVQLDIRNFATAKIISVVGA